MNKHFRELLRLAALSMHVANENNLYGAPNKAGMKFNPDYSKYAQEGS